MPRSEKPLVVEGNIELAAFALELRALRQNARPTMTYQRLAEITRFNPATLSKAVNGKSRPSKAVTLAYAQALGGDVDYWTRRWEETGEKRVRLAAARQRLAQTLPRPRPDNAQTPEEFVEQMRALLKHTGSPSLRLIEYASHWNLPRATLNDMLRRDTLPTARVLREFLRACDVLADPRGVDYWRGGRPDAPWFNAWLHTRERISWKDQEWWSDEVA